MVMVWSSSFKLDLDLKNEETPAEVIAIRYAGFICSKLSIMLSLFD